MAFGEKRHRSGERPGAVPEQEARQPAAPRRGAAGVDEGREELVADEGLAARECVPFLGIDGGDGFGDADAFQGATIQCAHRPGRTA